MIYLDTHVLPALGAADLTLFSKEARRLLDREPDIRISPMVVLELEYLREIKRIRESADVIVATLGAEIGLRVCDRSFEEVARQATEESWTRDPFDRLIVAQARLAGAILITRDTTIQARYTKAIA